MMDLPLETPTILVGTLNPGKLAEIRELLGDLPVRLRGAQGLAVEVREDGRTFEENARRKALAFARAAAELPPAQRPGWVLSDDSGLCVDALGGDPGIFSARFAGEPRSDERNNRKLLEAMAGFLPPARSAGFVCAVACAAVPTGAGEPRIVLEARGECRGRIGQAPRGSGGFGYDPLFIVSPASPGRDEGRTYAELDEEEKNRISHRGRALALFKERFRTLLAPAAARSGE